MPYFSDSFDLLINDWNALSTDVIYFIFLHKLKYYYWDEVNFFKFFYAFLKNSQPKRKKQEKTRKNTMEKNT